MRFSLDALKEIHRRDSFLTKTACTVFDNCERSKDIFTSNHLSLRFSWINWFISQTQQKMVGYEKYPYFFINQYIWKSAFQLFVRNQFIHENSLISMSDRFLDSNMDGLGRYYVMQPLTFSQRVSLWNMPAQDPCILHCA